MTAIAKEVGLAVALTHDGATGLARPPDLVLLDVQMPGMDGLEILREVRTIDTDTPIAVAPSLR